MDVEVALGQYVLGNPQAVRVRLGIRQRRPGGLLHHVAELAGQDQLAFPPHDAGFDKHDVAAHGCVIHPGSDADLVLARLALGVDRGAAEQVVHVRRGDGDTLHLTRRDSAGHLAGKFADPPLQLAHARLARIARDDRADGLVGDGQLLGAEALLAHLAGHQVALGDLQLLPLGVPRELDLLHAVEQRPGDRLQEVRRGDEEDFREIERDAEVVVGERVVLGRIQDLEQRGRRIALEGHAQLVHFIEEEDGVLGSRLLHALDDATRHRAHVSAPVAADVGLVPGAAQGDADVGTAQGPGDRLGDRRLAHARGAQEQQDQALRLLVVLVPRGFTLGRPLPQLTDGEEFQYLVLDVLEAVVVLLKDLGRALQIEGLVGPLVPRQLGDGLEVGADDLRFHRVAAGALQSRQLALDLLLGRLGELKRRQPLAQLLDVAALVLFAELLANRLQLLAEDHFALALAELLLHLGLDVLLGVEDADLPLYVHQHPPQPLLDREQVEQPLALGRGDIEVAGHEIGEAAGLVGDLFQHLPDDLVREPGLFTQLTCALAGLAEQCDEGRIVRLDRRLFHRLHDDRFDVSGTLGVLQRGSALLAVQDQLHAAQPALHLPDPRDRAHAVQQGRGHRVDIFALGDGKDQPGLGLERGLDGPQGGGPARADRGGHAGKQHHVPQRQDREGKPLRHSSSSPGKSHFERCCSISRATI